MARMCCSPSAKFTGKYNNNICTRKHVKKTTNIIYNKEGKKNESK